MEENKPYIIGGKRFVLKKEFTLDDWDRTQIIDSFYPKIVPEEGSLVAPGISKEEMIDLVWAVLTSTDGEFEKEFFKATPQPVAMEIILDFFFVYLESSINTQNLSAQLAGKWKGFFDKLKSSKKNSKGTKTKE